MPRCFTCSQAFFLLGADLAAAVKVCARQLADLQLALVLCKLHQASAPELIASILREELLPYAAQRQDSWLCCVAHLQLDEARRPFRFRVLSAMRGGVRSSTSPNRIGKTHARAPQATVLLTARTHASRLWLGNRAAAPAGTAQKVEGE